MINKKWMLLAAVLTTQPVFATIRPVIAIATGLDFVNFHNAQNIMIASPFVNTYWSNSSDNELVGNIFFGFETTLSSKVSGQLGVSYYQGIPFMPSGTIFQFADPTMGNLYYQFKIKSRRVLLEGKLLTTVGERMHPYVMLGFGRVSNQSYRYQEVPVSSSDVATGYIFGGRTYASYAYDVGVGADYDVTPNLRFGLGYRFAYIGSAGLGVMPGQDSNTTIKFAQLHVNEYLAQLSYLW